MSGDAAPWLAGLAIVLGYGLGSIPFGLLLARWAGLGDVRRVGSGNIGATNVLRLGNRKVAALTLLCDALKGLVPVLLMRALGAETPALIAGFSAFIGHLFPVWLKFKGGKGVATFVGVVFGLAWPLGAAFIAVWLIMAVVFRRSSLAALTASALTPLWAYLLLLSQLVLPLIAFAAAIWFTHRANLSRLLQGEEPRINLRRKA